MKNAVRVFFFLLLGFKILFAESPIKKPLTHAVYDSWMRVAGETISPDGRWIMYVLEPQEGDPRLIIVNLSTGKKDTIARGANPKFTFDSRYALFGAKAPFADVKKAKIAKKKSDDMPKDSLGIVRLDSPGVTIIPRVKSYKTPEKGSGWVAYQIEKEPSPADTSKKGSTKKDVALDEGDDDKEKKDDKGTTMVVRQLESGKEFRFAATAEYEFTKDGSRLLVTSTGNDSIAAGVFVFDTKTMITDTIAVGKGKYKQPAWDEAGTQAAFVADRDTSKAKQRYFTLYFWTLGRDSAIALADTLTSGMNKRWLINENGNVQFSKNGKRLFLGTAPIPMPEDTTLNEEETAKLDVWNWQDEYLQTQQVKNLDVEKKRSYLAVVDLIDTSFVQLGDPSVPTAIVANERNANVALGLADVPYRKLVSWEAVPYNDVYVIDVASGTRTKVLEKLKGTPSLSPAGHYITWYDMKQRNWFAMETRTRKTVNLTAAIKVPLYDELFDAPDDPGSYGSLGWTENDSTFLVYDRYDIWSTDPTGRRPAVNLTNGYGRKNATRYRYVRLDPEERFLKPGASMMLEGFNYKDKTNGYCTIVLGTPAPPHTLIWGPYDYANLARAKDDSGLIFVKSNFVEYPDLYAASKDFQTVQRLSDSNPQQKDYVWGTVELVSWKSETGKLLQGLLYKPENFDPKKKYPMLVYYYERMSDFLHRYSPPAPSRSSLNTTYCVSNGYVFFIPDIVYRIGSPGQSAYDAIVPGVKKILGMGFVDPKRVGIQGQSWGGYQTAYLITRTNMFRAAGAGAAVSNMTSAYGAIQERGLSRTVLYERSQSRIGGTLWERLPLYIENSPLFGAPKVQTPLLMTHNDGDAQVPWSQGIEFFTALRRLGKPVWMLNYNNDLHNLTQRKNMKDLSIRMMQFFDHYLKDAPMPVWMAKGIPAVNKGKMMGYELVQ